MPIPEVVVDVTRASQLDEVKRGLAQVKEFSVDVEADSMHHFKASLCFVQVGSDEHIWLLDTLLPEVKVSALADVFADEKRTKIFHAAMGDLQYLAEAGIRVAGLFDTHRAATLLNWPKVGLGDLVLEKLGATLKKEHQQADFSVRPLPAELRAYIADDVRYLTELGRMVKQACVDADILEEVELDCARMCAEAQVRPDISQTELKLPKQGLTPKQVALAQGIAKKLHALRLVLAEKADVPMGRMLSNTALGEVAAKAPTQAKELTRIKNVRGQFVRDHGEQVVELIKQCIEEQRAGTLVVEEEKKEREPGKRRREDALLAFRKEAAAKRKVTGSVILSNPLIEEIASLNPKTPEELKVLPYFGAKRLSLYGEAIVATLAAVR
ncbi:MAG: ribonuclease D [Archangiaceae bacterium]|nr:ribonuclease D [Archangiaceae bacterium]